MYNQMEHLKKIMVDFELHAVDGIKECFQHGFSAL
jgi:hypothetical protein